MSESTFRRIRERINLLRDQTQLPFSDLLDLARGCNRVGPFVAEAQVTVIVKLPMMVLVRVSMTVIVCFPLALSLSPLKVCSPLSVDLNV